MGGKRGRSEVASARSCEGMESPGLGLRGADVPWLGESLPPGSPRIQGTNAAVSAERQSLSRCRPVAMATRAEDSRRGMCWQAARRREDTGKTTCSLRGAGMGFGSIVVQRAGEMLWLKVAVVFPPSVG